MRQSLNLGFLKILPNLVGWFGIMTTGVALALYTYLGTFSRYLADDFCKSGLIVSNGFWAAQWIQYTTWSNRFSGMFTVGVSDLLGHGFIRFWTALTLFLWTFGLTWAICQTKKLLSLSSSKWMVIFLAEWIVFISLIQTPDLYQSLLWRMGNITYTLPLALMTFLYGMIIEGYLRMHDNCKAWGWIAGTGLLAFFTGGYSETTLALQTVLLVTALVFILLKKSEKAWRHAAGWAVGSAMIGCLISMIVVFLAPGNAVRLASMPAHPGLLALVKMDVISTFLFLYISLKNNAFLTLLAILGPMSLVYGYYATAKEAVKFRPSSLILGLFLAPLIGFLVIAVIMAPASYAQSSYPDGRVLIVGSFFVTLVLITEGSLIGMVLTRLHQLGGETIPVSLQMLTALLALVVLFYPLYDANKSYRLIPSFQAKAQSWDARDTYIRQARANGQNQIVTVRLDAPAGLAEPQKDPANWINVCMEMFYDVDSITIAP